MIELDDLFNDQVFANNKELEFFVEGDKFVAQLDDGNHFRITADTLIDLRLEIESRKNSMVMLMTGFDKKDEMGVKWLKIFLHFWEQNQELFQKMKKEFERDAEATRGMDKQTLEVHFLTRNLSIRELLLIEQYENSLSD